MSRTAKQMVLDLRTRSWGGARRGAGRKRKVPNRMPHVARPVHVERHPVHVTMRVGREIGSLREASRFAVVRAVLVGSCERNQFRVVHFSAQGTHVHMLVEAPDKDRLWRSLRGLLIRLARALNKRLGRRGRVFEDRYHARALKTPRETRACLAYVLLNHRHHGQARLAEAAIDPCSSGGYFDGWKEDVERSKDVGPVALPRTWLLRVGWRAWGLISLSEVPGARS